MVVAETKCLKMKVKKYKLVAPDGGWGYLVAVSVIICFSAMTAFAGCFGMMFNEFMIEVSMNSASVTLLLGIYGISAALSGFFTSALLNIMSMRWLAFASSVAFALGSFGTVVMTSVLMFYFYFGILQGIGLGIMFNLCCTIINDYFVEKRVFVMNFVQTAVGVMATIAPIFMKWALDQYGSTGALLLVAGISLQNFISVLLMQPVEWHMKKLEIPETTELKVLLDENDDVKKTEIPTVKLTDLEGNNEHAAFEKPLNLSEFDEKKNGFRKVIESIIDTSLIKTYVFSCASFGPGLSASTDVLFVIMAPQYLYSLGWSQDNVAMAIALYGFGDLSTRVVFTVISKWMFKIGVPQVYIIGLAVAGLSRIGMLLSSSVTAILAYYTLMGVAHCSIAVLVPLVVSDAVAPEKFTSAMGIALLFGGILGLGVGPAVGAVRDFTNSYVAAFYTATSIFGIMLILWPLELFIKNRKKAKGNSKSSHLNKEYK